MSSLNNKVYEFGDFRLDVQSRVLRKGLEPVALTPKVLEILLLLVGHSGNTLGKDELMRAVWPDSFVEESNLTQTIFLLRKALGETPQQRFIYTVPGRGYRFVSDVKEVPLGADFPPLPDQGEEAVPANRHLPTTPAQQELRAIAGPARNKSQLVVLALVLISATAVIFGEARWSGFSKQSVGPKSRVLLAVLPFQNFTGDGSQEYLSDGLTEEMIMHLGNLDPEHLGVIARTSVMQYKNSRASLDQIGRDLAVEYVLEGSIRRDSSNVRVTAQLIRVKDQTHIWARQYDREFTGLLDLQSEIAQGVADEIQLALRQHKSEYASGSAFSPRNNDAYDAYLKGQYFFNKRTAANLQEAIAYFRQATAKDPSYARAYAGLADSYALLAAYSVQPPSELMSRARTSALKALEIDNNLPDAHAALALIVQDHDWDWNMAEKEFHRAIELNPNNATAHHWFAEHLMWRGRFGEALQESEKARQLDPLSLIIAADNGAILYFAGRYDAAIAKWRDVQEMDPDFLRAHLIIGAYTEKAMYAEALNENEKRRPRISAASYWSWCAYVQARARKTDKARQAVRELLRLNQNSPIDPMVIALPYAALEDRNQALAWLERAYTQHSLELTTLKVNPAYNSLRGDPRFQDLLNRLGLSN
jgi:TolB-like protein/DNA-binding winged helix-turn-helix (wHTH) protein/Flp pilus assembly protein TadD